MPWCRRRGRSSRQRPSRWQQRGRRPARAPGRATLGKTPAGRAFGFIGMRCGNGWMHIYIFIKQLLGILQKKAMPERSLITPRRLLGLGPAMQSCKPAGMFYNTNRTRSRDDFIHNSILKSGT